MLQYDNLFYFSKLSIINNKKSFSCFKSTFNFSLKTNPALNPDKPPRALQVDVRALSCSTKGTPAQLRFQVRDLQS